MRALSATLTLLFFLTLGITAQQKQEMRAVWITNVDSYVLFTDNAIRDAVNYLAERGFNVIFPVVWNKGYTLYPSTVMNNLFGKPIWPNFTGRDPLKKIVLEAHRAGLEVIPWFEFGFASSYSANGGHIITAFPSWAAKNSSGQLVVKNGFDWMAGTNPQVQDFMLSLITEVIDNYDVDGVQGDDRLPAMPIEAGYDSTTKAIYAAENNGANPPANYYDSGWKRWRANKLNQFLWRLRDSVKLRDTNLIVSVAPSNYPWGYDNYLQDAKTWVDSGIVDNYIPQLYRYDLASYNNELNIAWSYVPASKKHIFFPGVLTKAGSYIISPSFLLQSVTSNRQKGAKGESFFFYEAFPADNSLLGDTLKKVHYNTPALLPYRYGNVWRPKATIVNEDDSFFVSKSGNWIKVPVQGYNPNIFWTNDTADASFSYYADFSYQAWYDVYVYLVPSTSFTQNARYTLYSVNDSTTVIVDQRNSANSGWVKIGSIYSATGRQKVVTVDNTLVEQGKYLLADAVMIMLNRKKSPNVVITSVEEETGKGALTEAYQLSQNFPNPFNPDTKIEYSVPATVSQEAVLLRIFDILGREVAVLVNEVKSPGNYSVDFNAESLSSGVYFYQLKAGTNSLTKKMLLLR